jgi:hypothetical protein
VFQEWDDAACTLLLSKPVTTLAVCLLPLPVTLHALHLGLLRLLSSIGCCSHPAAAVAVAEAAPCVAAAGPALLCLLLLLLAVPTWALGMSCMGPYGFRDPSSHPLPSVHSDTYMVCSSGASKPEMCVMQDKRVGASVVCNHCMSAVKETPLANHLMLYQQQKHGWMQPGPGN